MFNETKRPLLKGQILSSQRPFLTLAHSKWIFLCFTSLLLLNSSPAYTKSDEESTNLRSKYEAITYEAFVSGEDEPLQKKFKQNTFLQLFRALEHIQTADSDTSSLVLIGANKDLLSQNINRDEVLQIISHLLDIGAVTVAEDIFSIAKALADDYTLSNFNYLLASYHFSAGNWSKSQTYLTQIETKDALSQEQQDFATVMLGVCLQHQKLHRAAVTFYESIDESSTYYAYAQLNIAVAYIRQDWWTDAQLAIDKALKSDSASAHSELANRLHVVLGFNQLKHQFFRNARENFRRVEVESAYADQALLGIGLSALHQGDYVGAINAFAILQEKPEASLPVIESELLYAYAHDQMGEKDLASALYETAIAYYNNLLLEIRNNKSTIPKSVLSSEVYHSDFQKTLYRQLKRIEGTFQTSHPIQEQAQEMRVSFDSYRQVFEKKNNDIIYEIVNSYLSQAQFGQAKIFDQN